MVEVANFPSPNEKPGWLVVVVEEGGMPIDWTGFAGCSGVGRLVLIVVGIDDDIEEPNNPALGATAPPLVLAAVAGLLNSPVAEG